jgi:hypothetical protein
MDKAVPHKKLRASRIALAALPLLAWWLALAIWLTIGGGFSAMQDTPYGGVSIMAGGTIAVVVICMLLGGWARKSR